jgi:hypothetical protein
MSEFIGNDCLVLKLEEYDIDTKELDTNIYILYDTKNNNYVIRGRRKWTPYQQSCTYSFVCECEIELTNFLRYIICKNSNVNEILYNYNNFPWDSNNITFEFLNNYEHSDYEISGYNNKKFKKSRIIQHLQMLKNIYNVY